jgi:hypothetical protein
MSSYDIDFVALDRALKRRFGPPLDDPLAERRGHRLDIAAVQVQLLGNLISGSVQTHEIQAQDPYLQGLAVPGEDGPGPVIEAPPTAATVLALPVGLSLVLAVLDDVL